MIEAGLPDKIDYSKVIGRPFWKILESWALWKTEIRLAARWLESSVMQRAGAQGFPQQDMDYDITQELMKRASSQVRVLGQTLMPWRDWGNVGEDQLREQLQDESWDLMEDWVRYFEPENLEEFLERRKLANG